MNPEGTANPTFISTDRPVDCTTCGHTSAATKVLSSKFYVLSSGFRGFNLELRTWNSELPFVHPHRDPPGPLYRRTMPEGNAMRSCRCGLVHREPRLSRINYR